MYILGYLITCSVEHERVKYLSTDRDSGCYYWSDSFTSAQNFKSVTDANEVLKSRDFKEKDTAGGHFYPSRLIQSGLDININKTEAEGKLRIMPICLTEPVYEENVSGKIGIN